MIRCVAFDFDNTLVLSEKVKRQTFYDVVASSLHDALDEILAQRPLPDRFQTFAQLAAHAGTGDGGDAWAEEYSRLVDERIAACAEVPGAGTTIRTLAARGLYLAIVSDTPQGPLEQAVGARDWAEAIDTVRGRPIPKPDHLAHIVDELAIEGADMVMVGDRDGDRMAAETVGARFVQIAADDPVVGASDRPAGGGWPVLDDLHGLVGVIDRMDP